MGGGDVGGLDEQVTAAFRAMVKLPRSGSVPPAASIASVMAIRRIW